MFLTQIREHLAVIIFHIIESAGTVKGIQVGRREQGRGELHWNGHLKTLFRILHMCRARDFRSDAARGNR